MTMRRLQELTPDPPLAGVPIDGERLVAACDAEHHEGTKGTKGKARMPDMQRFKAALMLPWIFGLLLGAMLAGGCTSQQSANACTAAQTAAANVDLTVTGLTNAVTSTQAALAAVPPTDPLRKTLEPQLVKLQGYLFDAKLTATLARAAISTFCAAVPPPPLTPTPAPAPTPATQPSP